MFELLIVPLFTPDITSSITAMWNAARTGAGTSRASSKATSTAMRDMSVLPRSGQIAPASSLRQRIFVPSQSRDVARAHRCTSLHLNLQCCRHRDAAGGGGMDEHPGQPTPVTVQSRSLGARVSSRPDHRGAAPDAPARDDNEGR